MFAPNPHWWKEPADEYRYAGIKLTLVAYVAYLVALMAVILGATTFLLFLTIANLLHALGTGFKSDIEFYRGVHIQIRYDYLTIWQGDSILLHEDMREIASLEPGFGRKGKLRYHQLAFGSGKSTRIYANLVRYDELIAKLQGYLDDRQRSD